MKSVLSTEARQKHHNKNTRDQKPLWIEMENSLRNLDAYWKFICISQIYCKVLTSKINAKYLISTTNDDTEKSYDEITMI